MKYNVFFLLIGCYIYSQTSTVPSGSGTNTDPFLIESLSELLWVSEQVYGGSDWSLGKVFLQTNDIDASNTSTWTNGWIPIGGRTSPSVASTTDQTSQSFKGKYEGNNHTISNLHINNSLNYNGLFGSIYSANISNLHLIDVAITTSGDKTGGLVGFSRNGKIYNSSSSGTVTSTGVSVAGLIAQNNNGTIDSSYSTVNVFQTDNSVAGVLVALNQGTVKNCYSNGTIKGIDKFGGLIGSNSKAETTVTNSYSNSEVTLYSGSGTIYGGLVGELHTGIISDVNYWNTDKIVSGKGQITSSGTFSAIGRADAELKQQINFSGWDFKNETDNGNEDIWEIGSDGYPVFYNKGNVWTGATDTSWNNTSNWSQGILPSGTGLESKNIVTFPAGLTNYPSTSSANNKRAYSIKIENNAIDSSLYTFDSGTLIINDNILNVTLTDTDSDNIVSNSDVVTITATFSESMAATPTLSLSGIITNTEMTATSSASIWTYAWTVSTTVTSTTATVSGIDLSGNAYAGSDSITFTIDNVPPKAGSYQIAAYEYFEYDELAKLESLNGGSGWSGAWIDYGATNEKQGHYILSQTSRGNTDSSQSDGIYALNQRSSMTYPGLTISGNYLGGINWQTEVPTKSYRELYRKFGEDIYVQFLVQFNDFDNADDTKVKNNYFILQEDDTERLVIRRKNGRIYMAKTTSSSASNDIVDTGVALKGSTDAQLVIVNIGASKTKIWVDPDLSSFDYSNPPAENAYLNYSFEFNRINIESQNKYINGVPSLYDEITIFERSGSLSDTDSDNIVANSDVVTITATFSESMSATPTLNLSGITSNALMSATDSASVWTYAWTVSTTVTLSTATVSGTDLSGNAYAGTDSITFTIDNSVPTVTLTDTDSDNLVSNSDVVTITATFSESMTATPTLSLSGITSNVLMTATASTSVWTYAWTVSTSINSIIATVSGTDLAGNAYAGTDSITFTIDNILPTVTLTDTDSDNLVSNSDVVTITATFSESMSATPTLNLSGITSNAIMSATDSASVWTYAWTVSTTVTLSTATVSGTDLAGNAYAGTESLVFQIKPLNSGGASPIKSTISIRPQEMIANSLNSATITVQAKDSLGQNFLTGGAKIRIFALSTEYTVLDNNNGTYSASFIPDAIQTDTKDVNFTFSVEGITATNEFNLLLHRDQDGDGVYDINDTCPRTDSGLEVDAKGCALNQLDSDNDGVFDDVDECPDTPEFELNNVPGTPTFGELIPTVVDEKGCGASQRDTDGDGIVDTEDNCIETANADQADTDGDGIGDVCDTDNPLPQITSTEIKFVQLPQNGNTVGKIEATDADGEVLTFTQAGDNFKGVLSVASDGSITVSSGALLTFDSAYNGASLGFTLSDGENEVSGSVKVLIEDAPRPPEISIITLEISEDAKTGTIVGFIEAEDPMGGEIVSISLQGDGFIELVDGVLKTTQELDYETNKSHPITITAQASDRADGPGLSGTKAESIRVSDILNATYTGRFFISIFNVQDENLGAKVDHTRYFNPYNKNLGKWKVKKRIIGGADADKFTIETKSKSEQKNNDPVEDENEDYLNFITPPDYENPGDANGDNIYEVEVEYVNTEDGAPEVPIVVTQTNIQVPEGSSTTIELQSQPVLPTDDNDGDGIPDVIDNSPLVSNTDQTDEDGDGVGDVTDDFDHDGVWNPYDTCPDTPLGELVDLNGCLIYFLPASNFTVSKTEKCAGENQISIGVVDTSVTYNVAISGAVNQTDSFSSNNWTLEGLSAGVYSLCVTVDGVDPNEFERCFEVTITEPDPLVVSSFFNKADQTVSFDLNGGSTYQITQNGKTTQTSSSKYTLSLEKGVNNISISTGIECQGLFTQNYLNSYEVQYAPNPFKESLQLYFGGEDSFIELGVYASNGQLIEYENIVLPFGIRTYRLTTDHYKQGVYILKVKGETIDQSIQLIKE